MEDLALKDLFFAMIPMFLFYLIVDWFLRKPRVSKIEQKYVLITGCDTGFGKLAVLKLDKMGCHVFAGCLTDSGLMEISGECSDRVVAMKLDVKNTENIHRVYNIVSRLLPEGRGLWGLINNAGLTGPLGPYAWMTDKSIRHVMDVNVMGSINMVNTFLPLLKLSKGRIVNVSSIMGLINGPYCGPYCMAKHAIESFSQVLRIELYQYGVHVSVIEPGGHTTSFMEKLPVDTQNAWDSLSPLLQEEYGVSYQQQMMLIMGKVMPFLASKNPENVVSCYKHALFARFPRRRYLIGWDAKIFDKLRHVSPDWFLEGLFQLPFLRAIPETLLIPKNNEKTD